MFDLQGLDHIAITVRDIEASAAWYAEVLGLERRHSDVWGDVPTVVLVSDARNMPLDRVVASVDVDAEAFAGAYRDCG